VNSLPEDLLSWLHVKDVDADELRYLLMTDIRGGVLHHGGQQDVLYGAGAENEFTFLKVRHDPATDAIVAIEPGPELTFDLLENLRLRIEKELIESTTTMVGRAILLSESPLDGYFRYANTLQLLPVPPEAPRVVWAPGLSARHPFVLEVQFPGSTIPAINNFRRLKATLDFELTLGALIRGSIRSAMGDGRFHWVTAQPEASDSERPSEFLKEGYMWPGMHNDSDEFASASHSKPIPEVEPIDYYAIEPWTPTMTLTIPANLAAQLDRFDRLNHELRQRWLRACRWFQHSSLVRSYSYSAAFAALVISVESLIPEDTQNHRKFERFEDFVRRHVTAGNLPKDRVKRFHDIRSQFLHGNQLHYFDNNPLWIGLTPAMQQSLEDFNQMRQVARRVLVEWLARS